MGSKKHSLQNSASRMWKYEKIRFASVGIINTLVDFTIFLSLAQLIGLPAVIANILSTSCALIVSYSLNKKAVFGNQNSRQRQQFAQFVIVTLFGLWIIQAIVLVTVTYFLNMLVPLLSDTVVLIVAKGVATVASLVWNYMWYSRIVFKKDSHEKAN